MTDFNIYMTPSPASPCRRLRESGPPSLACMRRQGQLHCLFLSLVLARFPPLMR